MNLSMLKELDEAMAVLEEEETESDAAPKRAGSVRAIDYSGIRSKRKAVALKTAEQHSGGQMADRVKELTALKAQLSKSFDEAMVALDQKLAAAQAEERESEDAQKALVRDAGKRSMAEGILIAREFPRRGGPP